jgi:excinuclease ABC subunit C
MTIPAHLKPSLEGIPSKPGCYLMKDKTGKVIYVGKAISLRNRIRSYFHASTIEYPKTAELVRHINSIEWIVVGSELEALILEMNLIKRYRPKYNVRLKDDKRYPYIRVHWEDPFPKVTFTRRLPKTGSQYFGPYTSAWAVHQTLDILRKIFPYLTCDRVITGQDKRACLYFDIKLCVAPCIGAVDQRTYRAMISDLCRFLRGHTEPIIDRLQAEMEQASEVLDFEKAAVIRDQLSALEKVVEGHKLISPQMADSDVIAFARDDRNACVQIFFIRAGKLIGREYFLLDGVDQAEDQELVEAFLKQFYTDATFIPRNVLLPTDIEETKIIEEWLKQRREGKKVQLIVPRRGTKKELIQMATENASETLASLRAQWEADKSKHVQALADLQSALNLEEPPNRIECYDISNLQGTAAAGSMVVFEQGAPNKNYYRKFTIKTVDGQDDFASMEEVLSRRFGRWEVASEEARKPGGKLDPAFGLLPDLLIVDGGKGQLSRAVNVIEEHGLKKKIPVVGLAKKHEELYLPDRTNPVILPRQSQALFLIQRIRDEAHRFALRHHRTQRQKKGVASILDTISGIGPAKRKALLKTFGDIENIRNAKVEDLASVPGINRSLAERVKAEL